MILLCSPGSGRIGVLQWVTVIRAYLKLPSLFLATVKRKVGFAWWLEVEERKREVIASSGIFFLSQLY